MLIGLFLTGFITTGCELMMLGGEAIRSGQKQIEFVDSPGFSAPSLKGKTLGVFVSPTSFANLGMPVKTDPGVYGDAIASELDKNGFATRLVTDVPDLNDMTKLNGLAKNGIEVLMASNLSLEYSTSMLSGYTGGEFANVGVKEFVIRGIDTKSGKTLFRMTGNYGKTKRASDMAKDVAASLVDKVSAGETRP
jgi:hypothetical protein